MAASAQAARDTGVVRVGDEVRGTQSIVAVMSRVWRHPSWTAIEIAWRWAFAAIAVVLVHHYAVQVWRHVSPGPMLVGSVDLRPVTITEPADSAFRIVQAAVVLWPPVFAVARWLGPLLGFLWVLFSAVGRTAKLKRIDRTLEVHAGTQILLATLRLASIAAVFSVWVRGVMWSATTTITDAVAHGREPNLVGFFALVVIGSLVPFVVWSTLSWIFTAAPLMSLERGTGTIASLRHAAGLAGARMKLVEINLVMGITRVALLVLFMVFSACPLPFESVESAAFLEGWTACIFLLYLVASDYFQVIRTVSYLTMLRAFDA